MLPETESERQIWDDAIAQGFQQGIKQSKYIYQEQIGQLTQTYMGMALYHSLLAQNMISAPQVGQASLGVIGNNQQLKINEKIVRITAHSGLNTHTAHWKAALHSEKNGQ